MVLGAGIVGTSIALHLVKRGLSVALVDRRGAGEETSYGNTGVIGTTVFPAAFPRSLTRLARVALKRTPEANYHLRHLPRVARWLTAFRAASSEDRLAETARVMRPLLARALAEHEVLLGEAGATRYLRKTGFLTLYRSDRALEQLWKELALAVELGVGIKFHDQHQARELEPSLAPVFQAAVHWRDVASLSNPLAVTQAYAARFKALGGIMLNADARALHRAAGRWRLASEEGPADADTAVIALGPWTPDLLRPRGIDLPLAVKRGYHRHFRPHGNAMLTRPVVDVENGYAMAPMEQGIRITTGAEFTERDARPTPAQLRRVLPFARSLIPLGEPVETTPWMGSRPCFADSRPVIGPAHGHPGLWLAYGHGHLGLTLGPVSGRLIAEMLMGEVPFCDPAPYGAERFG
jgi:D-lysine oxidase